MAVRNHFFGFLIALAFLVPWGAFAVENDGLTLSITPPLFQLHVQPGQPWKSYIKVINSNPYELTVYAHRENFAPKGEDGLGTFIPLSESGGENITLGEWITITEDPIVIPAERSVDVPITVNVPEDAAPGGHFAAILVGTKPPQTGEASTVRTSQFVTSLFFIRVAGDIREAGSIREFSVDKAFHNEPEAEFSLRFENTGNVHLQPKGDITIYNMWGKERGFIPINQKSHFGNVLPTSIRKFDFAWKGESSIADIGRYTAIATLTFGESAHQNVDRSIHFWVIPVRATLLTVGGFLILAWLMFFMIRRYVRRALFLAGYESTAPASRTMAAPAPQAKKHTSRARVLSGPLREGVLDLRRTIEDTRDAESALQRLWGYARRYRLFFAGVLLFGAAATAGSLYLVDVLKGSKSYEVTVDRGDAQQTLSSEEVIKERMDVQSGKDAGLIEALTTPYDLMLINATTEPGAGARLAKVLEEQGFMISSIMQDTERREGRSSIVYDPALQDEALLLSQKLGNLLMSVRVPQAGEDPGQMPQIRVIIGDDLAGE